MAFTGLPETRRGTKPALFEVSAASTLTRSVKRDKQLWIETCGPLFLGLIDHFEHIVIGFGNQTHLAHRSRLLLRFPEDSQVTHGDLPLAEFCLPDTAEFKDQQIAPL